MLLFISFAPPKEPIRRLAESSPKANEPKKKRPEMPTSVKMVACYTSLIGATILPEVRAISGIALAPPFIKLSNIIIIFGFLMASENFGK
jgi:hypothetical protein